MMGININDKVTPFTDMILNGTKTVETRKTHSLRPYLGKRVGIIQTGKGKAHLVGFMTITKELKYGGNEFSQDFTRHHVPAHSPFYKTGECYGYMVDHITRCKPVAVDTLGIISRKIEKKVLNRVRQNKVLTKL